MGQDFDPAIDRTKMTIESIARDGYRTDFGFSAKKVEKGWWSFCREFGRPINMKGYYRVNIPSDVNSGTVSINLLSITSATKTGSSFFLALDHEGVPQKKIAGYDRQVLDILQKFKQSLYINDLNKTLENLEKQAARVSKKAHKGRGKSRERAIDELVDLEQKLKKTKNRIELVYGAY